MFHGTSYTVGGNINWCSHSREQCGGSLQTKNKAIIWSSNLTLGHISRKDKNSNSKWYMDPNIHSSTIYNIQDMEAVKMSINRGMDKEDVVHIYNGILLSHKKEWNNAILRNVDGPREDHTDWNKSETERQVSYDIIYIWNLKGHDINEIIKQKQTHRLRE